MKNWFLIIDKPLNWTSFDLIAFIRKKIWIKKVGHTWTLDPLATWLMLVWVWEWTKLLSYHKSDKKNYKAKIKFWFISETYDGEWPIKKTDFNWEISMQKLVETLEFFKWKIKQIPPTFSAIKINGQKLCNLARKWQKISAPERDVEIFKNEILSFNYPNLELNIECGSWTYIRSIAFDLWKKLWCWAYMSGLIRTWIEDLKLENAILHEEISEEKLLPLDFSLNFEKINISKKIEKRIKNWQRIWDYDLDFKILEWKYLLYSEENSNFIWIWKFENWILKWEKILNI